MHYAAMAWGCWVAWQFVRLCLAALLVKHTRPCFNGFRIIIPASVRDILTPGELTAIIAHEEGHRRHFHVWANFLQVCIFSRPTPEQRYQQELEADDHALVNGHGRALASALGKLSSDPLDLRRIDRILLSA